MTDKSSFMFVRTFFFILAVAVIFISTTYLIIKNRETNETIENINKMLDRVNNDIVFENGNWNLEKYLSDPYTPHPHGSSGFTNPLYIFTTNGFVIERTSPISGFLDTSDYQRIISIKSPVTFNSETNEVWRVMTKAITKDQKDLGVILVASYNPDNHWEEIDKNLETNLELLASKINIDTEGNIDVSNIDIRNIQFNVSFEVVNKYNKVLINNGRTPSFIDVSYVDKSIRQMSFSIRDQVNDTSYIAITRPLFDDKNEIRGVIVSAEPLHNSKKLFKSTISPLILISIPLVALLSVFTTFALNILIKHSHNNLLKKEEEIQNKLPSAISFDKQIPAVIIEGISHQIPYSSNQYYLLNAVFSSPKKRWENDEILDEMGEQNIQNSRKVYDAALAVNKKFPFEIVSHKDKTFFLNPSLLASLRTI